MFRPLHWVIIRSRIVPQKRLYSVVFATRFLLSRYQRDLFANTTLYSLHWGTIRDLMMTQCKGRNMLS